MKLGTLVYHVYGYKTLREISPHFSAGAVGVGRGAASF